MMNDLKYFYQDSNIQLIIEQDMVGFYLLVYKFPFSNKSSEDYLLDTLEDALQEAEERFGVTKTQWKLKQEE